MDNWFKSKWFVRAVSLVFAVILYTFVSMSVGTGDQDATFSNQSSNLHTLDDVPVDIKIDEEKFVVSGVPETVTVTLEGVASMLTPTVIQQNFNIFVDLRELEPGNHTVELQYENVPEGIDLYIEPKTIDVMIEERATRTFPVTAELVNRDQMAPGHEIVEYSISHEEVEITSSKSIIDQVGLVKVYINVADADQSIINREVPVNVYDVQGNELNVHVEPENIEVSVEVNNPSKEVPVEIPITGDIPEGYAVSDISANVEEVEVFATSDVLEHVDEVMTEEIDISDLEGRETFEVGLELPDKVYVPDIETVEVEVAVEPAQTFSDLLIEVNGLEEDQEVTFVDPSSDTINVTVVGDEEDLEELTEDDIIPYIDVEDLEPGEHEVPLNFRLPNRADLSVAEEHQDQQITIEIE